MAWDAERERRRMVEQQLVPRGIIDERVLDAMRQVPRHLFVPAELSGLAYSDRPLPIGDGQTISQPYIVALMLQSAALTPDAVVLDIGTGSGYAAAVASLLAERVVSIERHPALADSARETLTALGYPVEVITGDGMPGWPAAAPYDAVLAAATGPRVPPAWLEQLRVGGRLVMPLGRSDGPQHLVVRTKTGDGRVAEENLGAVAFVPLVGGEATSRNYPPRGQTGPMTTERTINDDDVDGPRIRASEQDGSYPRPQLMRERWVDLGGAWGFDFDDDDRGRDELWQQKPKLSRSIRVPFPPESPDSGINDTDPHRVVWYQRDIDADQIAAAGHDAGSTRLMLHFGAVDYRAEVWLNGCLLGRHEGGHTPFSFDVTTALDAGRATQSLVVRAEDDPLDVAQPRGKQDWERHPHGIWYHRTTGIWQPVWLEAVPAVSVQRLHWVPDVPAGEVAVSLGLTGRPAPGSTLELTLWLGEVEHGRLTVPAGSDRIEATIALPLLANGQGYENYLWTPEQPRLLDARVTLTSDDASDTVYSYLGLRSAAVERGRFLLNDRPYYVRSVLSQGYWPGSHLASPSAEALRDEVRLIKDLGFNAARVHQKMEDPRFLYWADRLGLLIWGEAPGAFEFSTTAMTRTIAEWTEVLQRDLSHPCIVTWVPLNESWGVQHIAHDPRIQAYARALFDLTKAIDPSRPVVSNDGWEHLDTDIWSVHDYESSGDVIRARYGDPESVERLLNGIGPAGRRIRLSHEPDRGQPVMLTEFGGVQYSPNETAEDAWGYSRATSADDFERRLRDLLDAVRSSDVLAGFCYTQLTDTLQEANGLADEHRAPKLPVQTLRSIITGEGE